MESNKIISLKSYYGLFNLPCLTQIELVQKCKGLLTLAQKAKVAKDGEFRIELSNRKPVNRLKLPQLTEFTKPDFLGPFFSTSTYLK